MSITAFKSPVSGLWPLGQITVATAGTPVALNTNVGAQTGGTPTSAPSGNVNALILQCPATNTTLTYLLRNVQGQTITKSDTGFIVAIVAPGDTVTLPSGLFIGTPINVDDYLVDADTNGNKMIATAVRG